MFHNAEFVKAVDLSKASLPGLAYILRNKDLWPKGFKWNYANPCNCANGLSIAIWDANLAGQQSAVPQWYNRAGADRNIGPEGVTPEMVADDIEKAL